MSLDADAWRHHGDANDAYYIASAHAAYGVSFAHQVAVDTLYAYPFVNVWKDTIDRIAAYVDTGVVNAVFRIGIYKATSKDDIYPNELIVDSGELSGATSATKREATISVELEANTLYWFVILTGTAAPVMASFNGDSAFPIWGYDNAPAASGRHGVALKVTQAYGALPATFPQSGASIVTAVDTGAGGNELVTIAVRYQD